MDFDFVFVILLVIAFVVAFVVLLVFLGTIAVAMAGLLVLGAMWFGVRKSSVTKPPVAPSQKVITVDRTQEETLEGTEILRPSEETGDDEGKDE